MPGAIGLARGLGMRTVTEGAETPQHLPTPTALGCDDVQGWAISRALPAGELGPLLPRPGGRKVTPEAARTPVRPARAW